MLICEVLFIYAVSNSDISDLYFLGRSINSPLKEELSTYHKKQQILQNCLKLKIILGLLSRTTESTINRKKIST